MNDARHRFQPATATALIAIHHRIIAELTRISHSTRCIERQNVYQLSRQTDIKSQTQCCQLAPVLLLNYNTNIIFNWEVEGKTYLGYCWAEQMQIEEWYDHRKI